MTDIDLPITPRTQVSQQTAVEQSRAVAEVQSAVVVAQQVPRDTERAVAEMRRSCGAQAVANQAFYRVPNRGEGPTVHLARELARIWGNVQYGVHELRRDDEAGESEIQAFAWDVQTNTRSTRTFIVPHQRMKGRQRQKLTDLGDVYLNNQNIGARAVRECIFTILPSWFTDEAEETARRTLQGGGGVALSERIAAAIAKFAEIDVTRDQLETERGKSWTDWDEQDVAQLGVTFQSIKRGEVGKDDVFPPKQVTAAEISASADPQQDVPEPEGWEK